VRDDTATSAGAVATLVAAIDSWPAVFFMLFSIFKPPGFKRVVYIFTELKLLIYMFIPPAGKIPSAQHIYTYF